MNGVAAGWGCRCVHAFTHGRHAFTHGRPGVGVSLCLDILPKASKGVRLYKGITYEMRGIDQYIGDK